MIQPTKFIHRVAMRCLGEGQTVQQIIIDEELEIVRQAIIHRLERLENQIRSSEEDAQGPHYYEEVKP